jgi:pSer/pThr/pTyr-binding forkhead associated (FHA) protein
VSRYHARLVFENGSLWLQDAGSRNGVFVNGVRVTGHKALKVGDSMTIAEHTFELRWLDDESSVEAPVVLIAGPGSTPGRAGSGATPGSTTKTSAAPPRASGNTRSVVPASHPGRAVGESTDEPGQQPPRRRWFWPFT